MLGGVGAEKMRDKGFAWGSHSPAQPDTKTGPRPVLWITAVTSPAVLGESPLGIGRLDFMVLLKQSRKWPLSF